MRSKHIDQRIKRINTTKYNKYLAGGFKPVLFPSLFGKSYTHQITRHYPKKPPTSWPWTAPLRSRLRGFVVGIAFLLSLEMIMFFWLGRQQDRERNMKIMFKAFEIGVTS